MGDRLRIPPPVELAQFMDGNDEVPILPIWESAKHLRDGQALLHEAKEEAEKSARPAIIATLIPPIITPTPTPTPIPIITHTHTHTHSN